MAEAPDQELELAIGPVPDGPGHPAEALVGFRVVPCWWALGLLAAGRVRPLGPAHEPGGPDPALLGPAGVTTLAARDGHVACVLGTAEGPVVLDREPPVGRVADVLARVFGRPTPPPAIGVAAWVEAVWLDRVAVGVLGHPARQPTWAWIAEHHPLRGTGPIPTPAPNSPVAPPSTSEPTPGQRSCAGGRTRYRSPDVGFPAGWATRSAPPKRVDDGSLSRWVLRSPPAEDLLADLLEVLPSADRPSAGSRVAPSRPPARSTRWPERAVDRLGRSGGGLGQVSGRAGFAASAHSLRYSRPARLWGRAEDRRHEVLADATHRRGFRDGRREEPTIRQHLGLDASVHRLAPIDDGQERRQDSGEAAPVSSRNSA